MLTPLPIDSVVPEVVARLATARAAVLVAGPGAGKTTRVPPALVGAGRVLVLQPRRVAVRAVAARIAEERGWTLGTEVGWHVRFERRFAPATPLVVVTEGILTARLQQDPLLSDVTTVVLDEFHERSLHVDVGLALARQAWRARDDLRLLVMSATLDAAPVARYLGDCPVIGVPGVGHPLAVEYAPGETAAEAVRDVLTRTRGQVLCFLPGRREIERTAAALDGLAGSEVVPLHGGLDLDAQVRAVSAAAAGRRRVVLATNIAETSLTVPGVSVVVDSGLVKVARYDAARGVDRLDVERVTADSATQRAGRAARLGPGLVRRLWDARDRLREAREPEVARVDLAGAVLDLAAWGADPRTVEWFEAPPAPALAAAVTLLERLGAVVERDGRLQATALGRRLQRWPLHVRLARILVEGGGAANVVAACALLAEGVARGAADVTTTCDLYADLDRLATQPPQLRQAVRDLERLASQTIEARSAAPLDDTALRRAIYAGYADRLARRRPGPGDRFTLASGHGATLARESGVRDAEFLVALDVRGGGSRGVSEARIHLASAVDPAWIVPTAVVVEHGLDAASGQVRAREVARVDALVVRDTPVAVDLDVAADILADAWLARGPGDEDTQWLRRLRFAGLDAALTDLVRAAARGARSVADIRLSHALPPDTARQLARLAPTSLPVPSGRTAPLDYGEDGSVTVSVKLQELFGLAETPRLGPGQVPVTVSLLAPNGRPVQTTRDLRSFWQRTYPEVRRELRGRYPKHPWPEDPWTAMPTHRTARSARK
ncbi:MAG: ATP-dependent RNA helicase [Vicinamibacterales bacterium]